MGISTVDVYAVDYGYSLKVSSSEVFSIPTHLDLNNIPRSISLCSLSGIYVLFYVIFAPYKLYCHYRVGYLLCILVIVPNTAPSLTFLIF